MWLLFQSTQPKRAATTNSCCITYLQNISIHAAQEGCDPTTDLIVLTDGNISIHAAQEGCDQPANNAGELGKLISIHAAQEGCDTGAKDVGFGKYYFNPRSPRGLRQMTAREVMERQQISIHAAQEGCDVGFEAVN